MGRKQVKGGESSESVISPVQPSLSVEDDEEYSTASSKPQQGNQTQKRQKLSKKGGEVAGQEEEGEGERRKKSKSASVDDDDDNEEVCGVFGEMGEEERTGIVDPVCLAVLTCLSFFVLFYNIHEPHVVVFDEVHFGGFASNYLSGKYFFDLHPPLAKLLIAFFGYLVGYDGLYQWGKIGDDYLPFNVPYVEMRLGCAAFGALLTPILYLIAVELRLSPTAARAVGVLVLFDNAIVTQSRNIFLDSFLMFFIALTVLMLLRFNSQRKRPFSFKWTVYLALTGASMGLALGVKMVGLFLVALVGLYTIVDLWMELGDMRTSMGKFTKHFCYRAVFLIALPIAIFLGLFYIHFSMLPFSGPGDAHMSVSFQSELIGSRHARPAVESARRVAYGSKIKLRFVDNPGCFLHSHSLKYPTRYDDERVSSQQQQVTCYAYADSNNWFVILPETEEEEMETLKPDKPLKYVRSGDTVRLKHLQTGNFLNSHDVAAPLTPAMCEVSCWINITLPMSNIWKLTVEQDFSHSGHVELLMTTVSLMHVKTNTHLSSSGRMLPKWASEQYEVISTKDTDQFSKNWVIEAHENERVFAEEKKTFVAPVEAPKLSFLSKFMELFSAMIKSNNNLSADHVYASRPEKWPLFPRGISYWHGPVGQQIYMIGNVVSWYAGFSSIFVFSTLYLIIALRERRRIYVKPAEFRTKIHLLFWIFVGGWALHYVPFFPMARQLFLHHYLPAVMFKIVVLCGLIDVIVPHRVLKRVLFELLMIAVIFIFYYFSDWIYGTPMSESAIQQRKWRNRWDVKEKW
eukprot:Nk52_evm6s2630 gene=Nk52_evmTU6s2630